MSYTQTRECADCGFVMSRELSERQAAFVELQGTNEYWNTLCSCCGSDKCASVGIELVKITESLLDEWGVSHDLSVCQQDEEIILGEPEYIEMILARIDTPKYLASKKRVLLNALCVALYDAIETEDEYSDIDNQKRKSVADRLEPELKLRESKLKDEKMWIGEYIKDVIFPYLNIEKT